MPTFSPYAIPSAAAINPFVDPRFNPLVDKGIVKQPPQGQIASDYSPSSDDTHSPPATPQQQSDANSTLAGALATQATPASYSSGGGIGPPPSDAMAKALLQNEEEIPLNRPFEAIGKLGALWGAQHAQQDYNKQAYERQVAPYRDLASALSGLPTDNPAAYRRAAGQRMLDIGAKYGIPDLISQGLQYETSPQTEWDWQHDAAGNPFGVDKYNPNHTMSMGDDGQLHERLNGQTIESSAGASGGTASPGGAGPSTGASAGVDPWAQYRVPPTIKPNTDTDNYKAYIAQQKIMHPEGPSKDTKSFEDYTLEFNRSKAPVNNTNFNSENKEAQTIGEGAGKREEELMTQADAAGAAVARMNLIDSILQRTQTGPLSGTMGKIGAVAAQLGISNETLASIGLDPNQATDNQAADKLSAEMVTQSIGAKNGGFPASNFSVAERQFLQTMFPNIANQPGSNQMVHDVFIAGYQRAEQKAQAWRDYKKSWREANPDKKNDVPRYEDFEDDWLSTHKDDNIFAGIQKRFEAGGYTPNKPQPGGAIVPSGNTAVPGASSPSPAPGSPPSSIPHISGDDDYQKLPSGAHFIDPNGRERVKP